jgi:glycosyltransferase 2 family protein
VTRTLARALAIAVVAMALVFALRGLSGHELLRALGRARLAYVIAGSLFLLGVGSILRAARYGALLPAVGARPRPSELWAIMILSAAANNVLPLRAGEVLRTKDTMATGVRLPRVVVAQVAEKVIEVATLVTLVAPVLATHFGFCGPAPVTAGLFCLGAVGVGWAARRFGVRARQLVRSFAWSLASDVVEIAIISVCLWGLGLPAGLSPSAAVYAGVNLAIAVPSTPASVGAFEAGAALPLIALGIEHDAAIAFALIYRAVQWLPVTLAGGLVWTRRMVAPQPGRARAS